MDFQFKILSVSYIKEIIPLIQKLTENKFTNNILELRFKEMFTQNYECAGIFADEKLI